MNKLIFWVKDWVQKAKERKILLIILLSALVMTAGSFSLVYLTKINKNLTEKFKIPNLPEFLTPEATSSPTVADEPADKNEGNKQTTGNNQNGASQTETNNSNENTPADQADNGSPDSTASLSSCGSNYSFFTASPLSSSDFAGLVPLGNLNPSGHVFPTDHIYFYLTNPSARYNLYSPGDATVTQISASEHVEDGFTDYSIYFQPCSELKVYFLHVSSLTNKLSSALSTPYQWDSTYSTGGKTYRNYGKNVSVSISSGEQIGEAGGNSGQNALDMGAYDTRTTISFANSSRWSQRSDTAHTVCPIDYYSVDLKNTLMARFGDYDGDPRRTVSPICGTIQQDVAETAQGAWFAKGTASWQGEDQHLALVHNNIDPNKAVFSVGTSMGASGLSSGTYEFYPQGSGLINRDFDDVSSNGNVYCYEPNYLGSIVILQLTSSTVLKIEKQSASSCGSGPWSFSTNYSEFER